MVSEWFATLMGPNKARDGPVEEGASPRLHSLACVGGGQGLAHPAPANTAPHPTWSGPAPWQLLVAPRDHRHTHEFRSQP